MNTFTYDFDELQPWPGLAVYCYGIRHQIQRLEMLQSYGETHDVSH